jgi:hypothetical protein
MGQLGMLNYSHIVPLFNRYVYVVAWYLFVNRTAPMFLRALFLKEIKWKCSQRGILLSRPAKSGRAAGMILKISMKELN